MQNVSSKVLLCRGREVMLLSCQPVDSISKVIGSKEGSREAVVVRNVRKLDVL